VDRSFADAGVALNSAAKEDEMVITVLEAEVATDKVDALEQAYRDGTLEIPPDIVETFLVRETAQRQPCFRIVTVWSSREALDKMRASGVTPKGVQMFQAAGAAPTLSVLEVLVHRTHAATGKE